jgi:fermentation-respiration switch protein FrsA (DUF1100 family)
MRVRLALLLATAVLGVGSSSAAAAPRAPFGHACQPRDGALFCPTVADPGRVPSFDWVPLDVDVWLPPSGDGPFPTIAMLHGFGGSKAAFEGPQPATYSGAAFARRGYAVVLPSARGFGRSCGVADSRTPTCARGWLHLDDQRYEARDVQWLLGLLVDQGVARRDALGVTGISYGGGTSLMLAALRNRVRLPDGTFAPWTSPGGVSLSLAAAWPRWAWSDLADALVPNARRGARTYASPVGVPLAAYTSVLFAAATLTGFVAPAGVDPGADITAWKQRLDRGEPYGADVRQILGQLHAYHGAVSIPLVKPFTPLLLQSGWTDDLFPVGQALRTYDLLRRADPRAPVALQLGDLGHQRGANHSGDTAAFDAQGLAFFDERLTGPASGGGAAPAPGSAIAYTQTCPASAVHGGGPYRESSFSRLARGKLVLRHRAAQRVTSSGGDAALAQKLSPLVVKPCDGVPDDVARGTAIATTRSRGFTLLGMTHVAAKVSVRGRDAMLVGRLWDVDPARGRQRLVDRGVVRLRPGDSVAFDLNGNGYRFARGHQVKLELLGRDSPTYRAANRPFSVTVRDLTIALPTRERQRAR